MCKFKYTIFFTDFYSLKKYLYFFKRYFNLKLEVYNNNYFFLNFVLNHKSLNKNFKLSIFNYLSKKKNIYYIKISIYF